MPGDAGWSSGIAATSSSAARTARSESSSVATGVPQTAITASPMNFSTVPPYRSMMSARDLEVLREELARLLGVASLGRGREADEVGEEDGDEAALGRGCAQLRGRPSPAGALVAMSGDPHSPQNFWPGRLDAPHDPQTACSGEPHSPQNFWPSALTWPQDAQVTPCTSARSGERHRSALEPGRRLEPFEDLARLVERAPPRPGELAVLEQRDREPERDLRARGSALAAASKTRQRVVRGGQSRTEAQRLRAEIRRAQARRDGLDRRDELLGPRSRRPTRGRLDRLDEPMLDRLDASRLAVCGTTSHASSRAARRRADPRRVPRRPPATVVPVRSWRSGESPRVASNMREDCRPPRPTSPAMTCDFEAPSSGSSSSARRAADPRAPRRTPRAPRPSVRA